MISLDQIRNFYPASMSGNAAFLKHILKEYVQLLVLDYLSATHHARKMTFIGGTNLRLLKGIDRFSEDLDFDCKNLSGEEFDGMSDDVLVFLLLPGSVRCGVVLHEDIRYAQQRQGQGLL